jgi:hypothetical protein
MQGNMYDTGIKSAADERLYAHVLHFLNHSHEALTTITGQEEYLWVLYNTMKYP